MLGYVSMRRRCRVRIYELRAAQWHTTRWLAHGAWPPTKVKENHIAHQCERTNIIIHNNTIELSDKWAELIFPISAVFGRCSRAVGRARRLVHSLAPRALYGKADDQYRHVVY